MTFPEPGMMFAVVIPPAVAMRMPGSSGLMLSSARTPLCTGPLISLPSELAGTFGFDQSPMCECVSTSPGIITAPLRSMVWKLGGSFTPSAGPACTILPSRIQSVAFSIGLPPTPVYSVALTKAMDLKSEGGSADSDFCPKAIRKPSGSRRSGKANRMVGLAGRRNSLKLHNCKCRGYGYHRSLGPRCPSLLGPGSTSTRSTACSE